MNQRASRAPPVMEKRVYGVPVFPGPSILSSPTSTSAVPIERDFDSVSRHSGEDKSPVSNNSVTSNLHWKLRHIDFIPNLVKSKKDDDYERFPNLVERANQWSMQNPQSLIFSCETVTWSTIDRPIFTDSGVMTKSMNSDKKTKFLHGLRVWYFIFDETFFDKNNCPGPFKLGFINYVLEGKTEGFPALLSKINGDMFKRTVAGKIVRLETLYMLSDVGDPDNCSWFEQPDKSRDYVSFIRLLYTFKKEGMEDIKYGDIGIRDFVPSLDQRTPHSQGYETYADLWRKASRYLYTNPHLKFINAEGVFVKIKKDSTDSQALTLWDRCNHCEHGSAHGSISSQKTEYLQILRLVYHQPPSPTAGPGTPSDPVGKKMFYKFFTPSPLKRAMNVSSDDQDPAPVEGLYEDLRQLEDKINSWLAYSGAKVAGVETISTRLATGGQEMFGPEATFVYNAREKNQSREPWRVNIRIYLEGEFKEVPVTWRNSIVEQTIQSNLAFAGGLTSWE